MADVDRLRLLEPERDHDVAVAMNADAIHDEDLNLMTAIGVPNNRRDRAHTGASGSSVTEDELAAERREMEAAQAVLLAELERLGELEPLLPQDIFGQGDGEAQKRALALQRYGARAPAQSQSRQRCT